MKPLVYLYQEQITKLFSADYTQSSKGLALSSDDNTVFHAFIEPRLRPAGYPSRFHLYVIESYKSFDTIDAASAKTYSETQDNVGLVVFLAIDETETLRHKAFVILHDEIKEAQVKFVPGKSELYSRSKGLLETRVLEKKLVSIIGLGSVGSYVAIELAKSGVGRFVLVDFDRLELCNIARHGCDTDDLGRFKTLAVREKILKKNPYADVETYEEDINAPCDECVQLIRDSALIICASDNDRSRFNVNEMALHFHTTALFGRAITRAAGGDVFRIRPGKGPCYNCLFTQNVRRTGEVDEELSQRRQVETISPQYVSEEEKEAVIQVGLSSDIAPISNMMVKLALVELSRGHESGIASLEEDLQADFYIWANRRERIYSPWPTMGYTYNQQTILRWYGARVPKDPMCPVCSSNESNLNQDNIFA